MRRAGDFRSLGNNVVTLDRASAAVVATDLYAAKTGGNRVVQAMAGLHYGEWGGLAYRTIYGLMGLATVPLFVTGVMYWWLRKSRVAAPRRTAASSPARTVAALEETQVSAMPMVRKGLR
jgi:uncharacterized iron-regulated membrane protein